MGKTLPNNWVETQLFELLECLETGSRPKGGVQNILDGVPSLGGEHLNSNGGFNFQTMKFVPIDFALKMARGTILNNDILIVKDGATTGKTSFVDKDFPYKLAFVNEHVFICRCWGLLNSKCIYYFLRSELGQQRILENFAGAAQGGINTKFVHNTLIPLPPLPEQERIANKLDALFAQLNGIRTAMERIPSLLKNFRQQVLTQALTGKLTDVNPQKKCLKELLLDVKYGTSKKSDYGIDGIPVLRIPNINEGEINPNDLKYTIFEEKEYEQLNLKEGDVLIIRSNGSISLVGQTAIVRKKHEGYSYAGYLIRMRCNQDLNPEFLNYSLRSGLVRSQIIDLAHSTSGVNNINAEQIKGLEICWFPIPDQQEIVRRVESLFKQADAIEQQYISLKQKIDNLPQAILHKAFNGELVEQLPTDGDARDLLRQIEELKELTKKKK